MSTTIERAKLGTTHLIPHGLYSSAEYAISVVGTNLQQLVVQLEQHADANDHVVLWHTARIRGFIEPAFRSLGFEVSVQAAPLADRDRRDVLEGIFNDAIAADLERRRLAAIADDMDQA